MEWQFVCLPHFLHAFADLLQFNMHVTVTRSTSRDAPTCVWKFMCRYRYSIFDISHGRRHRGNHLMRKNWIVKEDWVSTNWLGASSYDSAHTANYDRMIVLWHGCQDKEQQVHESYGGGVLLPSMIRIGTWTHFGTSFSFGDSKLTIVFARHDHPKIIRQNASDDSRVVGVDIAMKVWGHVSIGRKAMQCK